jgi:adenine/guanine phosphoribosyltransferase-like PRPP-binding protein
VCMTDWLFVFIGTLVAACNLVKTAGCEVKQCVVLVELEELNGQAKVPVPCHVLIKF